MNDFREFQKQYNDYLQHGLPYADDYICHFGILGMKWGVRRYQNPDGTLTPAGKSRYDKLNAKSKDYNLKRNEIYKKGINNMSVIDGIRSDYYDKKAESTRKEAKKYGTETPEEKLKREESDRNFTKIVNDNGFEYNSKYRDYRKKAKVKTSNNKSRDVEFVVDDHDRVKDEKAFKQTLDDFTKNFADHEKAIKNECKKDLLEQIKKYNMDEENAEYLKKMADNIGKGFFEVRYVGPNYLSIDLDDGVDDVFLPNIEYDTNKKKIMYGVTLND